MGATVSILPDRLSEEHVKQLAGDKFDQTLFDSFKDSDGLITKEQLLKASNTHEEKVRLQFMKFSSNGEMDSKTFVKLCKDTNLLDNSFKSSDADIIFASAKSKRGNLAKTITFDIFKFAAIPAIAAKKGIDELHVMTQIYEAPGPTFHGTATVNTRLHDDPSLYTGTAGRRQSGIMISPEKGSTPSHFILDANEQILQEQGSPGKKDLELMVDPDGEGEKSAKEQYELYSNEGEMDSKSFVKLCKEKGLIDNEGRFKVEDADIIYQKAKAALQQKQKFPSKAIRYNVFRKICVPAIAEKRKATELQVLVCIGQGEGPKFNATVAENVRLHDDKTTYTSTRRKSVVGGEQIPDGVENTQKSPTTVMSYDIDTPGEVAPRDQFLKYCPDGEMDSMSFIKMCRDKALIDSVYRQEDADLTFQKAKAAVAQKQGFASKAIGYNAFRLVCVPSIADKKMMSVPEVLSIFGSGDGPTYHATVTENVRLYDDTTTYTGVHAATAAAVERQTANDTPATATNGSPVRRSSLAGSRPGSRPGSKAGRRVSLNTTNSSTPVRNKSIANTNSPGSPEPLRPDQIRRPSSDLYMGRSSMSREGRRPSIAGEDLGASGGRKPSLDQGKRRLSRRGSKEDNSEKYKVEEIYVPTEQTLRHVKAGFLKFASDGEMTSSQYIKMMREAQLLNKVYNTVEAEILYMEAKQKAAGAGIPPTPNGHLSYEMYWALIVPNMAKKRGDSMKEMVTILAAIEDAYKAYDLP